MREMEDWGGDLLKGLIDRKDCRRHLTAMLSNVDAERVRKPYIC